MLGKKFDFFISYTSSDLHWAEWVDYRLNQAGYSTIVQFANFHAGHNFINEMHTALKSAKQVLGILSPKYLESTYTTAEWMAAYSEDPLGVKRKLIFVRVEECTLTGLLPNIVFIDLVGLTEKQAEDKLIQEIRADIPVRKTAPRFPVDPATHPVYPPSFPKHWHLPIRRKPLFVGRDQLIREIKAGFSADAPQVLQVLTGMGGAGKTRVAIEYCYQQIGHYELIWWIDGSEERLIQQGFIRLAKELSTVKEGENLNREELLDKVEGELRNLRWLLVFDNVTNPEIILVWLPPWPRGHIIVTSRNPLWSEAGHVVEVRTLDREHSIDFLVARSGDNDRKAAAALCEQLGDLPIALEQAGAYVERTGCGIESYATGFANRRKQYAGFEDETERDIAAVWSISTRRLIVEDPLAVAIVRVLSFFGPHRIPLRFLQAIPLNLSFLPRLLIRLIFGPLRFLSRIFDRTSALTYRPLSKRYTVEMALESLRRYALVEVSERDVSLHPLVRSVIRGSIKPMLRPLLIKQCAKILSEALQDASPFDEATKLWCLHVTDVGKSAEENSVASGALVKALIEAANLSAATAEEKIVEAPQTIEQALRLSGLLPETESETWEVTSLLRLVYACREADRFPDAAKYLREAINLILGCVDVKKLNCSTW